MSNFWKPPRDPVQTRPSRITGTMHDWDEWVGGLTRREKDKLYPGMHTSLIPAYEKITGMDEGEYPDYVAPVTSSVRTDTWGQPVTPPAQVNARGLPLASTISTATWGTPATAATLPTAPPLRTPGLAVDGLATNDLGTPPLTPTGLGLQQLNIPAPFAPEPVFASPWSVPAQPKRKNGILDRSLVKPAELQNPWSDSVEESLDAATQAATNVIDRIGTRAAPEANSSADLIFEVLGDTLNAGAAMAAEYGATDNANRALGGGSSADERTAEENKIIIDPYDVMAAMNPLIGELHNATYEDNRERGAVIDFAVNENGEVTLTPSAVLTGDAGSVHLGSLVSENSVGAIHTHPRKGYVGDALVDRGPSSEDLNLADDWNYLNGDGRPFVIYVLEVDTKTLYIYQAGQPGVVARRYFI